MPKNSTNRLWEIDALRGLAVLLMAFFHLMWNLQFFGLSNVNVFSPNWQLFARGIGSGFMLLLGLSLTLDANKHPHTLQQRWVRNLRRAGQIALCAALVSLGTYVAVGDAFVRFGILHLAAVSIVLGTLFVRLPAPISVLAGVLVLGAWRAVDGVQTTSPWLIPFGIVPPGLMMVDYYPLVPWFGMVLIGIAAGHWLYPNAQRRFALPDLGSPRAIAALRFLGHHSLIVYLLHQPILVGIVFLLSQVMR